MYYALTAYEHAYLYESTKSENVYVSPALLPTGFSMDEDGIRFDYYLDEPIMIICDVIIGHNTEKLIAIQGPPEKWIERAEKSTAIPVSVQIVKLILGML